MFAQLDFDEIHPGHLQARKKYGRYELSVILSPGKTLYEAAIFDCGQFVQLPGINYGDDVIPGLTKNMVTAIMKKLELVGMTRGNET
jgi:hypothetical protein|tara:strand:- start:7939 stop:8199 length:261 start_codon:yes stop_codon:yes gene_type:complete